MPNKTLSLLELYTSIEGSYAANEKEACMSPFVSHLWGWIGLICVVCSKQEERLAGEKASEEKERLQHSEGKPEENRIPSACGSNFTWQVLKNL